MKKLTSIFCALSLLIAASAFTLPTDDTVTAKVKTAFEKRFTSASEVSWKKLTGFYLASFKVNDQNLTAAFDEDGKLMSATRNTSLSSLPLSINLALQDKFAEYTMDNAVTEITIDGQSNYYIKGENAKFNITIKTNGAGDMVVENKTKKA